ncbi:MAG: hypothetical protein AAF809_05635 [Bacteroidota bacterium]
MPRSCVLLALLLLAASVGCDSSSETDPPIPVDGLFGIAVVAETPGGAPVEGLRVAIRPCFSVQVRIEEDPCTGGNPVVPASPVQAQARVGGVELTNFDVFVKGVGLEANVRLEWGTASETDNRGFEVQVREESEEAFTALGFVDGAGTTVEPQTYSFETTIGEGVYTFRLRQEDLDGTSTFSPEVEAVYTRPNFPSDFGSAYPTPLLDVTQFSYRIGTDDPVVTFEVTDVAGDVVALFEGATSFGAHVIEWQAADQPTGVYLVRMRDRDTAIDSVAVARWAILPPDATDGADVRGQTDADGRLVTADSTLAPAFYGPAELEYRDENNNLLGTFSMPPRVRITLIDPATGARQTYDRDIEDGPNAFVLTWDPA